MKHVVLICCLFLSFPVVAQNMQLHGTKEKTEAKSWYSLTQMSFIMGEMNESSPAKSNLIPSVTSIYGSRMSEIFSLGIGAGMTSFSYPVFPLFADFRFSFIKGNLSPVLALKGGYSIAKNSKEIFSNEYYGGDYKNKGGGMLNPEFGFKVPMTDRADFLLTVGYYYQHLKTKIKNGNSYYMSHERVTDINRLSFTIGFLFK